MNHNISQALDTQHKKMGSCVLFVLGPGNKFKCIHLLLYVRLHTKIHYSQFAVFSRQIFLFNLVLYLFHVGYTQ